jgi:hypothetical protein
MLAEFFVTFLLPRRVKRDPRIARQFFIVVWRPWRWIAARRSKSGADTMLGVFGPIGLLFLVFFLAAGVIVGFAGLHWAERSDLGGSSTNFANDLYFSAGSFFTASTVAEPAGGFAKVLQIAEAASGFAVLFISIGYLPALFQSFSRREAAISQLDPRAGSPPSAGALLERTGERGWSDIDGYLREWEVWTAEVMETQLAYPIIGWFRSQHVNQNWLAALTTVVDACAFSMAFAPSRSVGAEMTFAIGRHALSDLAFTYRARVEDGEADRLSDGDLDRLMSQLRSTGLELSDTEEARAKLAKLRRGYESNAIAIAERLALALPGWLPGEDAIEYWRLPREQHRGLH